VAAIMTAQIALQMGSYSAGARTGYGIYAKAWPEVVDLADSHVLQATAKASAQLSTAATTTGLYAWLSDLPYYAAKWYTNSSLSLLKTALLPIGAQLDFKYRIFYTGFNGTLGPYPQAVEYSRWNLDPVRSGFLTIPGATLYRLVVTWQSDDYGGYYVVTYGAHVSEPGAAGEVYNVALADLLRKLGELEEEKIKSSLFAFLVDSQTCKLYQLPWWAEIKNCPLCLLHVRLPSSSSDEVSGFKLEKGKAVEVLLVFIPNLQGDEIPVLKSGPCASGQPMLSDIVKVNKAVNNEPKAAFAPQVGYEQYPWGGRPAGYSVSYYWGADEIASWGKSVVNTQGCYHSPTGGVIRNEYGVTVEDVPDFRPVARVYARYAVGTTNWAFNVYYKLNTPQEDDDDNLRNLGWRGFTVEALVKPLKGIIRPARLDLYYAWNTNPPPPSRHPICAYLLAVQAVVPAIVWTNWYAGNGVWNGRTWDDAGSLTYGTSWYLFSISADTSRVVYSVYSYNTTRPLIRLATKTTTHSFGGDWRFYIVLGSAIVDNPASGTPEEAYYAYVRVRPWVDPPPSVSLAPVDKTPLARPGRVDVVALSATKVEANINASGSVGLANVERLNISRTIGLSVKVVEWSVDGSNPNQDRYHYRVRVESTIPRGAVAAQFTLFYSLGSTYVNTTCVDNGLCTATLAEYLGYSGGRDVAEWEVEFTVPKRASHAIFVNVFGSKVAVSTAQPKLYALGGGTTWYLINEGDGTGVLYIPWKKSGQQVCTRWLADYSPKDPRFIGVYDVKYKCPNCGPCESWTVVLVPPGSLVRLDFTDSVSLSVLNTFRAQWQPPILPTPPLPSCPNPIYVRFYIPGNASKGYYVIYVPPSDTQGPLLTYGGVDRRSAYAYLGGSWKGVNLYRDGPSGVGGYWVRLEGDLTNKAVLAVFCQGGTFTPPQDLFRPPQQPSSYFWTLTGPVEVTLQQASLNEFKDGFTVVFGHYRSVPSWVALYNGTWSDSMLSCASNRRMVGIQQIGSPKWWWDYDGFCYDRHIWELYGAVSGERNFTISVARSVVLYQIFTSGAWGSGQNPWLRSYPNVVPSDGPSDLRNRAMTAFQRARAGVAGGQRYSVAVIPFTWPRPFFYVDSGTAVRGPFETT